MAVAATTAVADVVLTTVYGLSVSSSYVVDVATVATPYVLADADATAAVAATMAADANHLLRYSLF